LFMEGDMVGRTGPQSGSGSALERKIKKKTLVYAHPVVAESLDEDEKFVAAFYDPYADF